MRSGLLAAALLTISVAPAFADGITPTQIGEAFCISRLSGDEGPITGLLTADLSAAIAEAWDKNDAYQKANPEDKPPLGDGLPWSSFVDYASECTVGDVTATGDTATLEIHYGFPESPEANYTDLIDLKKVDVPELYGTAWRIDNVSYVEEGSMQELLGSMFDAE